MNNTILKSRARILHDIRAFFYQRNVLEVETPALSQAGNTDPSIESFQVQTVDGWRYLHTSPEYPMKRLLAQGSGDIYQIAKVWRAGELGRYHNPEFTMLEWYRLAMSYHQLMQEVDDLLTSILFSSANNGDQQASRFVSYRQLFLEALSIDPHIATATQLQACINKRQIEMVGELDDSAMLDLLMTHCIEPDFGEKRLTFVYDYPASQKALAQLSNDKIPVAQRFEVYYASIELGNGYQEQTDVNENSLVLHADSTTRHTRGMNDIPVDERFLADLQRGMPACSGVAIGIDRLLMCQLGEKKLEEVISFPWTVA